MKRLLPIPLALVVMLCLCSCGKKKSPKTSSLDNAGIEEPAPAKDTSKPVTMQDLPGTWTLRYPQNYGYTFRFYPSYKALVIIYLNNHSLVFKGVYSIKNDSQLLVNIIAMKRVSGKQGIYSNRGFKSTRNSQFMFQSYFSKKKQLVLKVKKSMIDGSDSNGYFEKHIALRKIR
jgi:hypothetical protein